MKTLRYYKVEEDIIDKKKINTSDEFLAFIAPQIKGCITDDEAYIFDSAEELINSYDKEVRFYFPDNNGKKRGYIKIDDIQGFFVLMGTSGRYDYLEFYEWLELMWDLFQYKK